MLGKRKEQMPAFSVQLYVKKGIAEKDNDSKTGLLWSHNERQWKCAEGGHQSSGVTAAAR